jgi:hypothetical protein
MRLPSGAEILGFREVFAKKSARASALDRHPLDF